MESKVTLPTVEKSMLIRLSDGNYCVSSQLVGVKSPEQVQKETEKEQSDEKSEESTPEKQESQPSSQEDDGRRKGSRKRTVRYDPAEYVFPALKRTKKTPSFTPNVPSSTLEVVKGKKKRGRKPVKKKIMVAASPVKTVVRRREEDPQYYPVWRGQSLRTRRRDKEDDDNTSIEAMPCSICNFSGNKTNDKMINCSGCSNQGHQNCISKGCKTEGKWFCPDCKESAFCAVCEMSSPKDSMICCDLCGENFHRYCHVPQVRLNAKQPWRCSKCPTVTTVADIASILGTNSDDNSSSVTLTASSGSSLSSSFEDMSLTFPKKEVQVKAENPGVKKEKEEYPGYGLYESPERLSSFEGEVKTPDQSDSSTRKKTSSSSGSSRRSSVATDDTKEVKDEPEDMGYLNDDVILVSDAESEKDPLDPKTPKDPLDAYPVDLSIPDPSAWSAKQVAEYFGRHFEETVAATFEDQDIDGQSLLLMRRGDVLKGMGFKLGVALRVLYHVKKLQIRRSDLHLLWTYQC